MKTSEIFARDITRMDCEDSHSFFTRYFFKRRNDTKFIMNWHHHYISDTLEKVITGEIKNLVINVPPGSSKTEMAVINFMARGLALNPRARFLHLSSSEELALLNSQTTRDVISSEDFQAMWPNKVSADAKSKSRWNIEIDGKKAGGVYATSLSGQITGFRAGHMSSGFQGAIIIDDPFKPNDAFSDTKTESGNRTLLTTVNSRRASPDTPIILIMQRISEKDPTAFIESKNMPGEWTFLKIPALIDEAYIANLPEKYREMVDRSETDGKGRYSYWPVKEPIDKLLKMESGMSSTSTGAQISRYVFAGQYMQNPVSLGGNVFKGQWFTKYAILPKIKYRKVYADTAQKTKQHNDFSVFECWGMGDDGKIYLLDLLRGKWEGPDLRKMAIAFWAKQKAMPIESFGSLRDFMVEDKSSGTDLIQSLRISPHLIPIKGIERNIDKLTRAMDGQPYIAAGFVCIPESAAFTLDFIQEFESFTPDDTHAHDDQIDPCLDAVYDLLSNNNKLRIWEQLGKVN